MPILVWQKRVKGDWFWWERIIRWIIKAALLCDQSLVLCHLADTGWFLAALAAPACHGVNMRPIFVLQVPVRKESISSKSYRDLEKNESIHFIKTIIRTFCFKEHGGLCSYYVLSSLVLSFLDTGSILNQPSVFSVMWSDAWCKNWGTILAISPPRATLATAPVSAWHF